jgi:hypothetical protein
VIDALIANPSLALTYRLDGGLQALVLHKSEGDTQETILIDRALRDRSPEPALLPEFRGAAPPGG